MDVIAVVMYFLYCTESLYEHSIGVWRWAEKKLLGHIAAEHSEMLIAYMGMYNNCVFEILYSM